MKTKEGINLGEQKLRRKKDLCEEIEELREVLNKVVSTYEYPHEDILIVSQKLDKLINEYYRSMKLIEMQERVLG